jgi:ElaB/YqjD/DUF883 family membrane-anchored ribosome-binding protein
MSYNENQQLRRLDMSETMRRYNQKTNQLIAEHPIETVVVTSVIGYVIGRVLRSIFES